KVLIAEDNVEISDMLRNYLIRAGHAVFQAFDGRQALETAELIRPDVVLLDIMMPVYDGYYVCEEIRKKSRIPIIITSAICTEDEKLRMFELGADDYMTKPFSFKEAVCRVNAQLRRYYESAPAERTTERRYGDLTINSSRSEVTFSGEIIPLSVKEFRLLDFLTKNENTIFSKQRIMDEVWGIDEYIEENTVAVTVARLRDKLALRGVNNLVTVWGFGYKWQV
ncbi:MAG: response regulator transcription factor, partial [Christensenellales bacterium]